MLTLKNSGKREALMKKIRVFILPVLLACFVSSCTTTTGTYKPSSGLETVLGTIQTRFKAGFQHNMGHIIDKAVYIALLEAARKEYQDPIDICDITWVRDSDPAMKQFFATGTVIRGGNDEFLIGY
jgi:hypothetical protein